MEVPPPSFPVLPPGRPSPGTPQAITLPPPPCWRGESDYFFHIFPDGNITLPWYVFMVSINVSLRLKCIPRLCWVNMRRLVVFCGVC